MIQHPPGWPASAANQRGAVDLGGLDSFTTFDGERLRKFARRVAQQRASTPLSTLSVRSDQSPKGFFRKLFTSRSKDDLVNYEHIPAQGWFLIVDATQGWKVHRKTFNGHPQCIEGFEEGRVLVLLPTGDMSWTAYRIVLYNPKIRFGADGGEDHKLDPLRACTSQDLISFDRLNKYSYRQRRAQRDEVWRYELGAKFYVREPPGIETSLALKRFLEQGSFIRSLGIRA